MLALASDAGNDGRPSGSLRRVGEPMYWLASSVALKILSRPVMTDDRD
jgi:hypothetical protein